MPKKAFGGLLEVQSSMFCLLDEAFSGWLRYKESGRWFFTGAGVVISRRVCQKSDTPKTDKA